MQISIIKSHATNDNEWHLIYTGYVHAILFFVVYIFFIIISKNLSIAYIFMISIFDNSLIFCFQFFPYCILILSFFC